MKIKIAPWIKYALLGFLGFGITNFLLGCIVDWSGRDIQASISAPMLVWLAMGIAGLIGTVVFKRTGRGFIGIPKPKFVWVAVVAGFALSLGMLTLKLGLASEPTARGPIVAISTTNSMLVAALSFFFLKEALTKRQLFGFLIIIIGLVIIGLSSGNHASFGGLVFGLLTMLLFGITNYLLKYAGHSGTNSVTATVILWLSSGVVGVLALSGSFALGRGLAGLHSPLLWITALVAGFFLALGMLGIKIAVTKGPGGPAAAITGANALLVTVLDRIFFGHMPPPIKLAGMATALGGIGILVLTGHHKPKEPDPALDE
jgi:drug/metabolite transporter (DMT)-like permease